MTWYPTASMARQSCHRSRATNSHFPRIPWLMVLSRLGVSELDKTQSWKATGDETGDVWLAGKIFTSYQQQSFLRAAFFFPQWKRCPQLCQQAFWADCCSQGNRQEAPLLSLLESMGSPQGLVRHTGSQSHHETQRQSLGFDS